MDVLDQQGFKIKVGVAYQYMFGQGDRTTLVVKSICDDGVIETYDVLFKMDVKIKDGEWLWRPLKHTWSAWPHDSEAVIKYAGESALDLTP